MPEMSKNLGRWIKYLFSRKKKVFYSYLLLVLLTSSLGLKVKFLVEIEEIIDSSFKSFTTDLNDFVAQKNLFLLISTENEHFTNKEVCSIGKWWSNEVEKNQDLDSTFASFKTSSLKFKNNQFLLKQYVEYNCRDDLGNTPVSFAGVDNSPWSGILNPVNRNNELLLTFSVHPLETRGIFGTFNTKAIDRIFSSFEKLELGKSPHLSATWGGSEAYFYYLVEGYIYSMALNLISVFLLCLLLSFLFQSYKTGILFYCVYQLVIIPMFSIMGAIGFDLDTLSNTLPIMILLACLQDFIFISYHHNSQNPDEAFKKLMVPGFFTSLTTAIGFGSLMAADLPLIRRFGFITGTAALLEFVVLFFILPGLLQTKYFKDWKPRPRITGTSKFNLRIPRKLAYPVLLIPFLTFLFLDRLNFVDFPENLFPKTHTVQTSAKTFLDKFAWTSTPSLLYSEEDRNFIKDQVLPQLRNHQTVARVENYESIVDDFSKENSPLEREILSAHFADSGYAKKMVAPVSKIRRTILYVNSSTNEAITSLWSRIDELCKGRCRFVGDLVSYTEFSNAVITGFHKSILTSLLLVMGLIICVAFYKREKHIFKLIASSLWGPLALMGLFVVFQIPIFFVSSVVISIILGLTGDNALFFLLTDKTTKASEQAQKLGRISSVVMLCYLATLSCLLFSYFGALRTLSLMMLVGLMLSLFGDLVLFLSLQKQTNQ